MQKKAIPIFYKTLYALAEWNQNRLKKYLKNASIEKIIEKMDDNSYIFPKKVILKFENIIDRSDAHVSWFAYERAREINNILFFNSIKNIIEDKRSNSNNHHEYYCLSFLFSNSLNEELFDYLIEKLKIESKENFQAILMDFWKTEIPNHFNHELFF